jgi:hypothetical protein
VMIVTQSVPLVNSTQPIVLNVMELGHRKEFHPAHAQLITMKKSTTLVNHVTTNVKNVSQQPLTVQNVLMVLIEL